MQCIMVLVKIRNEDVNPSNKIVESKLVIYNVKIDTPV